MKCNELVFVYVLMYLTIIIFKKEIKSRITKRFNNFKSFNLFNSLISVTALIFQMDSFFVKCFQTNYKFIRKLETYFKDIVLRFSSYF